MADQAPVFVTPPSAPRFNPATFLGIVWGGFTLATVFVASRAWLRFRTFRRFYVDDGFVLAAWLMVLATSILWQLVAKDMFLNNSVSRGVQIPPPDFVTRSEVFLKASTAVIILFYSTLWSIKLSFLFFFRRLYINVGGKWMRFWWAITIITIASWAVCIGNIDYKCLVRPLEKIASTCNNGHAVRFQKLTLILNCILDTLTDVLITCIPITMLWKVRISTQRKLALGGVFSVTVFTIVFAITRVSLIASKSWREDMTWLYNWSNIEGYAALIVSSLGSFRSLFVSKDSPKQSTPPHESPPTIGSPQRKRKMDSIAQYFESSLGKTFHDSESQNEIIELKDPISKTSTLNYVPGPCLYERESSGSV